MALPTTIVSDVGLGGHHPPFKSSGGDFYSVVRADADELDVYKATDPTDSWTIQDSVDGPVHAGTILGFATVQDGDVIHMIVWSSATYEYYTFDMSTDQWGVDQLIETPTNAPTFPWGSIAVRSDGDVVVVYAGDTDQVMGGKKERVDFNVRTGSTWGGAIALDNDSLDRHYGNPNCILGTNDFVHCTWQKTTLIADPPTIWADTDAISIDPADDSKSTLVGSGSSTERALLGEPNVITYDDGGTQRIIASGFRGELGTVLETAQFAEDVNDEVETIGSVTESFANEPGFTNGEVGISTFAPLSAQVHCLYSGDGTDGVDQDLWYTTSGNDGIDWSSPTEEIDAITVNFIAANIYIRGTDTVLAYIYDDAGVQKYNEKILSSGGANPKGPFGLALHGPFGGPI